MRARFAARKSTAGSSPLDGPLVGPDRAVLAPPPRRIRIVFKNIGATWILHVLQLGVVSKLAPFVVHSLGREQNGVWVTIVSLTGFLGLAILGVPMASVRYVAEHVAKKDLPRTNAAISTCLAICLGL